MALTFSLAGQERIRKLLEQYPTKMSACLPVLWIAQEEFGWISDEATELVAKTLDLPTSHVHGVVSFYTMYNRKPVGKYHVQVCTNTACMLRSAYDVLAKFESRLGICSGETRQDGMFTLNEVECLAACGTAPCVQINDRYYEPVNPQDVDALVDKLIAGEKATTTAGPTEKKNIETTETSHPAPQDQHPREDGVRPA